MAKLGKLVPNPVEFVRLAFSFDTPGLMAGLVVATLHDGDFLLSSSSGAYGFPVIALSIIEAWDGSSPSSRLVLDNGVDDPYAPWGDNDMTQADYTTIGGVSPIDLYQTRSDPLTTNRSLVARGGDIAVILQLDDSVGGDPGSMQGQAELTFPICRAVA